MELSFSLAFIAGLVSFLSPCVLPLVPAYIGYMGGRVTYTVAAQAGTAQVAQPTLSSRVSTITHGLAFVAGFAFVFVALGLLGTAFVQQIGARSLSFITDIIGRVGGVMIIFFGLHFMGVAPALFRRLLMGSYTATPLFSIIFAVAASALVLWAFVDWLIALPIIAIILLWLILGGAFTQPQAFWQRAIASIQRALYADTRRQMVAKGHQSYASSALMGVVFSAGWTPCIGPIYGAILTMALTNGDVTQAGALLGAYSLGLGVPFLLTAALLDSAQTILRGFQRHLHKVELVSGAFLIAVGLLVASGSIQNLSRVFSTQFADFSYRLEECVLELNEGQITIGQFIGCVNADTTAPAAEAASTSPEAVLDSAPPSILDLAGDASSAGTYRAIGTAIGNQAPDFETVNAGGEPFVLSEHRGEVVLLNFWATWCGPCRDEMPVFERAYQRQADDGLLIVGVNFDESAQNVTNFSEEFELSFPLVLDEGGDIQKLYGVRAYPTTYLIDRNGTIIAYHAGPLSEFQIQNLIRDALA